MEYDEKIKVSKRKLVKAIDLITEKIGKVLWQVIGSMGFTPMDLFFKILLPNKNMYSSREKDRWTLTLDIVSDFSSLSILLYPYATLVQQLQPVSSFA